jgi:DNA-binding PadR family transcriptional regulator
MRTQDKGFRPKKEFLSAWLLLIIRNAPSYGYQLLAALKSHGLDVDPPNMYKTLRALNEDSLLDSRWVRSQKGPRQRLYSISKEGEELLDSLVGTIRATRDIQDAFLEVYEGRVKP